ncbi:unnamed protein product [Haemonchus placei]|uniref:Recep_L_domain domain-containing protein n=1 Tax=Haemonchus placei TaxID=6290 RepID=A0A0N4WPA1_HAEPC|nr:unnamed protein product [Haemonchus placei]
MFDGSRSWSVLSIEARKLCSKTHSLRSYFANVGPALRIVGNERLEKIVFNESVIFTKTRYPPVLSDMVVIRGNRKLSTEAINNITHIFHSYRFFVPRVGECAVPGRVIDLSQLNCESYYGDIAFSQDVVGELPTIGGSVDGCLVIEDTLIRDIEFIKDFDFKPAHICKNRIVRNKYLCISEGLENHLRRKMNITIRDNLPKGCRKCGAGTADGPLSLARSRCVDVPMSSGLSVPPLSLQS